MKQPAYREKAMLYRLDTGTEKGDGIRRILRGMSVAIMELTPEMLVQTVGACAGISGFPRTAARYDGPEPEDDVLIMVGFSDKRINQLLGAIRTAGLPRIGLMATVTDHNRSWTLQHLIGELASERLIMGAWMSLQQAAKAAEAQPATPDPELARALAAARVILDSEEPPRIEAIRQADTDLRAHLPGPV